MDENDKTYLWLVLLTFVGFLLAIAFAFLDLRELQEPLSQSSDPFTAG